MSSSHITNDQSNNGQPLSYGRRASLSAGTVLSDFFTSNRGPSTPNAYPGPIASAAAQANQRRRMSMSNVTGTSPPHIQTDFRRGSVSSVSSTSSAIDEQVVEDGEPMSGSPPGMSPFARRLSFGARALRDVRIPAGRTGGYTAAPVSSPTVARGFWPENGKVEPGPEKTDSHHQRRQSMSTMPQPVSSIAKEPPVDPFQERMLKGDFYMD
ncbi:hypothetical protein RUND412_000152 [Rhizina undulata]